MNSVKFLELSDQEKKEIFSKVSDETGMPPYAVEKDWWVTQVLSHLLGQILRIVTSNQIKPLKNGMF